MRKHLPTSLAAAVLLTTALSLPAEAQSSNTLSGVHMALYSPGEGRDRAKDRKDDRRMDGQLARHRRENWRDDRRESRWDSAQHNGYTYNKRWHYGPPPARYYERPDFYLGYQPWARGQRIGYYQSQYTQIDYRTLNRRRPIRGYHWVRDDRGDALLVSIATGIIADIIINGN